MLREGVDRLGPYPIEPYGELKYFVVVFCTGVDYRNAFHHFSEGNSTSVVSNFHPVPINLYDDARTVAHDILIDTVIDHLFQQNVDTVIYIRTIPQATDIHPGSQANMLEAAEGFDRTFIVLFVLFRTFLCCLCSFCHDTSTAECSTFIKGCQLSAAKPAVVRLDQIRHAVNMYFFPFFSSDSTSENISI